MTVCMVISLLKIPYIHLIYVWFWPTLCTYGIAGRENTKYTVIYRGVYIRRFGQYCMYTPYMTVYLVISLPKIPYIHRIYVWF